MKRFMASAFALTVAITIAQPVFAQVPTESAEPGHGDLKNQILAHQNAVNELNHLRHKLSLNRGFGTFYVVGGLGATAFQLLKGAKLLRVAMRSEPGLRTINLKGIKPELSRAALFAAGTGLVYYVNSWSIERLNQLITEQEARIKAMNEALGDLRPN